MLVRVDADTFVCVYAENEYNTMQNSIRVKRSSSRCCCSRTTLLMTFFCVTTVLVNIYMIVNKDQEIIFSHKLLQEKLYSKANGDDLLDSQLLDEESNRLKTLDAPTSVRKEESTQTGEGLQLAKPLTGEPLDKAKKSKSLPKKEGLQANEMLDDNETLHEIERLRKSKPHDKASKSTPLNTVNDLPEIEDLRKSGSLDDSKDNRSQYMNVTNASPKKEPTATIAYAVSLTGCQNFQTDGAAVLKHSIHMVSYPFRGSRYAYKMYVFAHPSAANCTEPFRTLGYEVLVRETPIDVADIRGDFLREKVGITGCCGEKEFLKLYSYTLTDHQVVVHLDLDSLIMQPLDDLFDAMLEERDEDDTGGGGGTGVGGDTEAKNGTEAGGYTGVEGSKLPVMFGKMIPKKIDAYFTRDYNMVNPGKKDVGIQGGFIVVRPNRTHFEEYRQVILEGNFIQYHGWARKYGGYFGAQQIQGLCAYFYDGLHPGTAVELDRCIYNSMVDNPYHKDGKCRDNRDSCSDCRTTDFSLVKSVHFTLCQKPWVCPTGMLRISNCKAFHHKWFSVRKDLDEQMGVHGKNTGQHQNDTFLGYCKSGGERGYIKFEVDAT